MSRKLIAAALAAGVLCLGGCASVTSGIHQQITVNTNPAGASCVLDRKDGQLGAISSTPGSVTVRKTKNDINIVCNKDGYQQATYLNHSGVEEMTVGNVIIGGGIGWAIDSSTGSDNKYTAVVNITMIPATAQTAAPASAPAPAAAK